MCDTENGLVTELRVWVLPSPQLITAEWVSSVPGSMKLTLMVALFAPQLRLEAANEAVTVGATFVTMIVLLSLPAPPSLSVALKLTT